MDGAGRLARSLRSLRPQADLKAAALGAVILLRERLGLRPARARPRSEREHPPHWLIALVERYFPHRAGVAARARDAKLIERMGRIATRLDIDLAVVHITKTGTLTDPAILDALVAAELRRSSRPGSQAPQAPPNSTFGLPGKQRVKPGEAGCVLIRLLRYLT